ncbi:MAG: hypothetical protein K0S09_69 [Sphingobacteriaceae bacterium]|jgi:uncharacterized protein|nr:hypothetical protein [Sphingobacteriaceae bacterium]
MATFRNLQTLIKFLQVSALLALLFTLSANAQNFPEKPNKLVNDYTGTLSADEVNRLEQKLVAFNDSTSTQIAVVLIKSLNGYDIADYAVRLAEKWGVGGSKNNNGIMVLAALNDRKLTIQTGYGVEGALPDAITARIRTNEINPYFKEGRYYEGLDRGTDAIISYTKGEYKNDEPKKTSKKSNSPIGIIIFIIIMILIFRSRGGGGGRGGSQIIGRRGGASPFWWMLAGSAMGRSSGGGWGGFSGGSGGFGGGGGGGFGGFGGGSFGGGGSSGSW